MAVLGLLVTMETSSRDMDPNVLIPRPRGPADSGDVLLVLGVPGSSCSERSGEL